MAKGNQGQGSKGGKSGKGSGRVSSSHPDDGGNWPSTIPNRPSGSGRGNATPKK